MRRISICLALTGTVMGITGCGMPFSSSSSGGLAVVDLSKIAAETGKDIQLKESFQIQENSVKQQLAQAQLNANSLLETKLKEVGETPTEDQQREVVQLRVKARNALGQLQNQANTKLSQYMQDQIAKFRAEIKPVALEIARKRGLSVVVPKNDGLLLAVDSGVDITDDVIKAYREKQRASAGESSVPTMKRPAKSESDSPRTSAQTKEGKVISKSP